MSVNGSSKANPRVEYTNASTPVRHNTYADRAAHFRAQAAAARAADRHGIAAQLDTLARRADTAHRIAAATPTKGQASP